MRLRLEAEAVHPDGLGEVEEVIPVVLSVGAHGLLAPERCLERATGIRSGEQPTRHDGEGG